MLLLFWTFPCILLHFHYYFWLVCNIAGILMCCGQNLLFMASNRPSIILPLFCYICWRVSRNCRSCLPSQVLLICPFSVWFALDALNILFTSNVKFLSSLYLPAEPQFNVGWFKVGVPSLEHVPVHLLLTPVMLSPTAVTMICTVAFATFTASCAMACIIAACSFMILSYFLAS